MVEQWEYVVKALGDETRRCIVSLLLSHDLCVGALARRMEVSEAAVSQHLRTLREAGLVTGEKRGYYTHYTVNRKLLKAAAHRLLEMASRQPADRSGCLSRPGEHTCCGKEENNRV